MSPFDFVFAVALLTSPTDTPDAALGPEVYARLQPALQTLALQWEILDPREVRYVLTRAEDFGTDVRLLQRRYRELAGAPSLNDCNRFPERAAVSDLLAFNRAYRQHVDVRQPLDLPRWWQLRETLQETDRLYQVWDTVRDARCEYYYVTVRRQALKKLREMVGEEAYYSSQLPPHVPTWRFQRIN